MGRTFQPQELGDTSGDFLKSLASDVANKVCDLYQNNPLGFIDNPLSENPVSEFNRGLWDNLCGNLPVPKLPANPVSPFNGGQCACAPYVVNFTVDIRRISDDSLVDTRVGQLSVWGPVTGIAIENPAPSRPDVVAVVARGSGPSCEPNYTSESSASNELFKMTNLRGVSIVRQDGQQDNCGSPPPTYGGGLPPENNPYTHNYDPGNGRPTIDTNYEIDFFPDFRGPLVRFPDLPNICLAFTAFGVEFDLCTNKPGEGSGGDIDALADKLDQLQDTLDEVADAADELANREPTQDTPQDDMGDEEGEKPNSLEECVSGLRFVRVVLTKIPPNANVETGLGGRDLIDDAGWLSFRVAGSLLPPQRIVFTDSLFEAPEGVECFSLKLNFGFKASVSKIVKADD